MGTQVVKKRKMFKQTPGIGKQSVGFTMMIPGLLVLGLIQAIPFFYGLYLSFTDKNIFKGNKVPLKFVGLGNYIEIFTDRWAEINPAEVFGFTMLFAIVVIVVSYVIGLYFAILLNRDIKFRNVLRALAFLPWFVNPLVVSICWTQMMSPAENGILNAMLMALRIIKEPLLWRGASDTARLAVIILGVWKSYPMLMVMLLAALQGIDKSIYEAAVIEGATEPQKFFYITLPMLKDMSVMVIALQFVWMFGTSSYDIIMPFTGGGPVTSTYVLTVLVFQRAFSRGKLAYAAALSVCMMLFLALCAIVFVIVRKIFAKIAYQKDFGIKKRKG